jgi:plasmid replication initiation protein
METKKLLRKHVAIIHIYSLMSALERKIFNVLLSEASNTQNQCNHNDSVAVECRIPFSTLSKAVNFNSNNVQYLKEAIDGLASLKIEWNLLKDKVPRDISFLNLRVLHGPPTFYQDSTFNFSFHKVMLDLNVNPAVYGTVDLSLQSQFESKYSHALYENSTRFVHLQKNKIIHLDTLRKLLGVDSEKYLSMKEFNRNVILPATEEVNDRSDFIVNLNSIKVGRKITGYELLVESKQKVVELPIETFKPRNKKICEEIRDTFGDLSKSIIDNIFQDYTEEYIFEKIDYTKKFAKKEPTGFSPIRYFISALKNDYKQSVSSSTENIKFKKPDENEELKHGIRTLKADISHWEKMLGYTTNPEDTKNFQKIIDESKAKLHDSCIKIKILEEKNHHL